MIEREGEISVKRQAQLLDLSRSRVYYAERGLPERDLKLMRILDELHLNWPFYGARKLARELQNGGHEVGRRKTLSWRVSNTMTPDFCVEALQEALEKYGKPEIFNTDQGS